MASGTVSSIAYDNWQLIQTNSTTSGSSTVFSGLSGYKKYMIVFSATGWSAADTLLLRFNSSSSGYINTGTSNRGGVLYNAYNSTAYSGLSGSYGDTQISGYAIIDNVLTAPKTVTSSFYSNGNDSGTVSSIWTDTSAITSLTLSGASNAFNKGSITLYGVAA